MIQHTRYTYTTTNILINKQQSRSPKVHSKKKKNRERKINIP